MAVTIREEQEPQSRRLPPFLEWLVGQAAISQVVAERVARVHEESSDRLNAVLLKLGLVSETALAQALAA